MQEAQILQRNRANCSSLPCFRERLPQLQYAEGYSNTSTAGQYVGIASDVVKAGQNHKAKASTLKAKV